MSRLERLVSRKSSLTFGGTGYSAPDFWTLPQAVWTSPVGEREQSSRAFDAYVERAFASNGVVFACVLARMMPFSEARFQWQRFNGGRPGDLFGDRSLGLLERPWRNGTTGELLSRMLQDADLGGNAYVALSSDGSRLRRLRPDWVTIVTGSPSDDPFDLDAEPVGYVYRPGGGTQSVVLSPDRVAHWSPTPDPLAQWRGMSWLTPVLREIEADSAAMLHKRKFFEKGATINLALSYDPTLTPQQFKDAVQSFRDAHEGVSNAYKTLHIGGGADPKPMSFDLRQLDFKATQGHGETRIAAAAGVGAIIARFSEGMAGSSLNQGNYGAAKRQFADMTLRPLWRSAAASLEAITPPPDGARLWYDDRDVEFLKEDQADAASILSTEAQTVRALIDAGFEPDAALSAVANGDLSLLRGTHTGLFSVQLQAAGALTSPTEEVES